jgi:hypothetical protein
VVRVTRALASCSSWTAAIAGGLAVFGCQTSSTTTSYTPITGIQILPSTLLQDLQCGTGDNQVYRYVALVSDAVDGGPGAVPIASNVFDCFTTGLFENLPASDAGSQQFYVAIYAYSRKALPSDFTCPGGFSLTGGVCPALEASVAEAKGAEWTATCLATQQQGIPVLAVCGPLVPSNLLAADASASEE